VKVDRALSSEDGLSPPAFANAHGVSVETVDRYVFELVSMGARIKPDGDAWRYDAGQARLFTAEGERAFE
jgi:hypothetical protein